ncbi:hypothetical protein [Aeribacillus sp. FSL M8-0235]|uniref:hypothetical protein n=1 Tax=Aeribacillus sp. FSL M8-0235 TaxID=2954576 RepID=UPI0030F63D95
MRNIILLFIMVFLVDCNNVNELKKDEKTASYRNFELKLKIPKVVKKQTRI